MEGFDHLRNWKLKVGSHAFPGPDGGTCINEAALVAAGFEYRPIHSVEFMPKCFSRPICRLAMRLNDDADDEQRQRLLPYVSRLACADTPEFEQERAAYINERSGRWWGGSAFEKGLQVLEGALAIGRQADLLPPQEVTARMEAVRRAKTPTSVPDDPVPPTLKSWTKKEHLPA